MQLTENLKWRYATKKFEASKKVSEADIEEIKNAIQLSASSYGLQLYKVLIIEDQELKNKLKAAAFNQSQVTDASHLIVFCNYKNVESKHVDDFLQLKANIQKIDITNLDGYGQVMKNKIASMSESAMDEWTTKQVYIALGNLLAACAELKIDACPMEGFDAQKFNEILDLESKGLNAAVLAPIGYRAEDDKYQFIPKVRKPFDQLFEQI